MSSRRPTSPRGSARGTAGPSARRSLSARAGGSRRPGTGTGSAQGGASRRTPAAARRRGSGGPGPDAPRGLTRRAAVLAVLLLVAAVTVAPYLRSVAAQQADIAALEADVAEREQAVDDLETELRRWNDPAYVTARARQRLFLVMPGETGYVVLDPPTAEEIAGSDPAAAAEAAGAADPARPWFGTLWESVRIAGADPDAPAAGDRPDVDGSLSTPAPP